jgi:hypothetical protein
MDAALLSAVFLQPASDREAHILTQCLGVQRLSRVQVQCQPAWVRVRVRVRVRKGEQEKQPLPFTSRWVERCRC